MPDVDAGTRAGPCCDDVFRYPVVTCVLLCHFKSDNGGVIFKNNGHILHHFVSSYDPSVHRCSPGEYFDIGVYVCPPRGDREGQVGGPFACGVSEGIRDSRSQFIFELPTHELVQSRTRTIPLAAFFFFALSTLPFFS